MPVVQFPDNCEGCGGCCYGLLVQVIESDFDEHGTPRDSVEGPDAAGDYYLKQDKQDHGRCVHLDPETRRCTIYENRPEVCRIFTSHTTPCANALGEMLTQQNRAAATPKGRVERAIEALAALEVDDLEAVDPSLLVHLNYFCLKHQGFIFNLTVGAMVGIVRKLELQTALLSVDHKPPAATGELEGKAMFATSDFHPDAEVPLIPDVETIEVTGPVEVKATDPLPLKDKDDGEGSEESTTD